MLRPRGSISHSICRELKAKRPAGSLGITVAKDMRATIHESDLGAWTQQTPSSKPLTVVNVRASTLRCQLWTAAGAPESHVLALCRSES